MKGLIAFHDFMVIPNNINLIIRNWGLQIFSPPKMTTRRTSFIWVHSTLLTIEEKVMHTICSVIAVFIWRLSGQPLVGRRHPFGTPLPARSYCSALTWLYSWYLEWHSQYRLFRFWEKFKVCGLSPKGMLDTVTETVVVYYSFCVTARPHPYTAHHHSDVLLFSYNWHWRWTVIETGTAS